MYFIIIVFLNLYFILIVVSNIIVSMKCIELIKFTRLLDYITKNIFKSQNQGIFFLRGLIFSYITFCYLVFCNS